MQNNKIIKRKICYNYYVIKCRNIIKRKKGKVERKKEKFLNLEGDLMHSLFYFINLDLQLFQGAKYNFKLNST